MYRSIDVCIDPLKKKYSAVLQECIIAYSIKPDRLEDRGGRAKLHPNPMLCATRLSIWQSVAHPVCLTSNSQWCTV
jgi:hypothetical protein